MSGHVLSSVSDLKPAPYNPRTINPEARAGLASSLQSFGDLSGIVWNSQSGHIVAGHQRIDRLKALNATFQADPPALILNGETFPIRVVDWDEETEQAANITANNQHIAGTFNDNLQPLLSGLSALPTFENLRLGLLVDPVKEDTSSGSSAEVPFAEDLLLEHNYVVLYFDNALDWSFAQEILGLEKRKEHSWQSCPKCGIGRVIPGRDIVERLSKCPTE